MSVQFDLVYHDGRITEVRRQDTGEVYQVKHMTGATPFPIYDNATSNYIVLQRSDEVYDVIDNLGYWLAHVWGDGDLDDQGNLMAEIYWLSVDAANVGNPYKLIMDVINWCWSEIQKSSDEPDFDIPLRAKLLELAERYHGKLALKRHSVWFDFSNEAELEAFIEEVTDKLDVTVSKHIDSLRVLVESKD